MKIFYHRHTIVQNLVSRYNNARGIWWDTNANNNTLRNSVFVGNTMSAIGWENSFGPNYIYNNIALNNSTSSWPDRLGAEALWLAESSDVHVFHNTFVDNLQGPYLTGGARSVDGIATYVRGKYSFPIVQTTFSLETFSLVPGPPSRSCSGMTPVLRTTPARPSKITRMWLRSSGIVSTML